MQIMLWLCVPAIYCYVGPRMALVLAHVLNLIVAPQCVAWLSDYFSGGVPSAQSLRPALLILAPTGVWTAFHY